MLTGTSVRPAMHLPRKIPLHLKPKLRAELDRMENLQIICKRNELTDWVSAVLTVENPNGQLREHSFQHACSPVLRSKYSGDNPDRRVLYEAGRGLAPA